MKRMYLVVVEAGSEKDAVDGQMESIVRDHFPTDSYVIHLTDDDQSFRIVRNQNRGHKWEWGWDL
jgi:hypothetical protein